MALTNLGLALADCGSRRSRPSPSQTRARTIFVAALGPTHSSTLLAGERLADALVAVGQPVRAQAVRAEVDEAAAERFKHEEPVRSG